MKARWVIAGTFVASITVSVLDIRIGVAGVPVTCLNCSTLVDQLKSYAMQGKQLAMDAKGWVDVANSYALAAQNTLQLPMSVVNTATGMYQRTAGLVSSVNGLVGSDGTIMQRLNWARGIGSSAGEMPNEMLRSSKFWAERADQQLADDMRLLDLQGQREVENEAATKLAEEAGFDAMGQLETQQVLNMNVATLGREMNMVADQMRIAHTHQLEREQDDRLQALAYQNFMAGLSQFKESESAW